MSLKGIQLSKLKKAVIGKLVAVKTLLILGHELSSNKSNKDEVSEFIYFIDTIDIILTGRLKFTETVFNTLYEGFLAMRTETPVHFKALTQIVTEFDEIRGLNKW